VLVATSIAITLRCAVSLARASHRLGWVKIPEASRRIGCFDGLRGYLAVGVFMYHCLIWLYVLQGHEWSPPPGNAYANLGQATVALFFMITSILFYPKILRRLSGSEWLAHFISRIFRAHPAVGRTESVGCFCSLKGKAFRL
jgi:peptidoglycan/LPS O-acetylase OafA/YrhL